MLTAAWALLLASSVPWVANHLGLGRWLRRWLLEPGEGSAAVVCAVIPARDEAAHIGACVDALLATDVAAVVVVDDGSTDGTADVAARREDARLVVVRAPAPPPGWSGKSWACQHGADRADSEWLLFVDADVTVHPRAPGTLVGWATRDARDLVSVFGTWVVVTLGERLLVPSFGWLVRGAVPMQAVEDGRAAFANGQVILVRRQTYAAAGGHGACREDVLDDVGLARAVHGSGGRVGVRWAPWAVRLRPYGSGREVVAGYRKNLYAGLDRRAWLAAVGVVAIAVAYLGPVSVLVASLILGDAALTASAGVALLLQLGLRVRLELLDGRSPWIAALDPLAGVVMAWTLALAAFGGPATWKGRTFVDGRAEGPGGP